MVCSVDKYQRERAKNAKAEQQLKEFEQMEKDDQIPDKQEQDFVMDEDSDEELQGMEFEDDEEDSEDGIDGEAQEGEDY